VLAEVSVNYLTCLQLITYSFMQLVRTADNNSTCHFPVSFIVDKHVV